MVQSIKLNKIADVVTFTTFCKSPHKTLACPPIFVDKIFYRNEIVGGFKPSEQTAFVILPHENVSTYIAFFLNSLHAFYCMIAKDDNEATMGNVTISRLKEIDIIKAPNVEDCIKMEAILSYIHDPLMAEMGEEEKHFFISCFRVLQALKNGIIMELLQPDIHEKYGFSIIDTWHEELQKYPDNLSSEDLAHKIIDSIFTFNNPLLDVVNKWRTVMSLEQNR